MNGEDDSVHTANSGVRDLEVRGVSYGSQKTGVIFPFHTESEIAPSSGNTPYMAQDIAEF